MIQLKGVVNAVHGSEITDIPVGFGRVSFLLHHAIPSSSWPHRLLVLEVPAEIAEQLKPGDEVVLQVIAA